MITMTDEQKKAWAISKLQEKADEIGRLPQKADFDDATRFRTKAFLDPWPRALETVGLKPVSPTYQRRIEARGRASYYSKHKRSIKKAAANKGKNDSLLCHQGEE